MAEVILFHHAQGRTSGVLEFADRLRVEGHHVYVPDLYEGRAFASLAEGVAYADGVGFARIAERGEIAAANLPAEAVYAGFSLGVLPAQLLTQTRPGARGALLMHSCVPTSVFERPWPAGVPAQIHAMEEDKLFVEEGDLQAARELAGSADGIELFLYPGDQHLFADSSLGSYDPAAAELLLERVLGFLAEVR